MKRSTKIRICHQGASMLFSTLPLSRQTLTYTAGVIRRHRAQISSPWRKLTCGQQALLVLVSGPLPGAVHDLTAARIWGILRELAASRLVVLADKGYHGTGRRQGNRLDCKPARSGREPQGRRTGLHAV
jgi:hypothetical protein